MKFFAVMLLCLAAAGCGAGLRPGCKVAAESGYCKYQLP